MTPRYDIHYRTSADNKQQQPTYKLQKYNMLTLRENNTGLYRRVKREINSNDTSSDRHTANMI